MIDIKKINTKKAYPNTSPGDTRTYRTYQVTVPTLWAERNIRDGKQYVEVKEMPSGELLIVPLTIAQRNIARAEDRAMKRSRRR